MDVDRSVDVGGVDVDEGRVGVEEDEGAGEVEVEVEVENIEEDVSEPERLNNRSIRIL